MALMTLIFFFVLSRFTFSIGRTISKLRDFALNVEKDRIPENEYVFPNDELGDISKNIVGLYHRQQKAKDELSMEREKLIKHFQYAKEVSPCSHRKAGRYCPTSCSYSSRT